MKSPTHHKSPTVAGTPHLADYESTASSFSSFPQRPQSTIFISHTAPMTIPEGKSAPVLSYHEATKLSSSPLKSSPEQFGLEAQVSTCTLCIIMLHFVLCKCCFLRNNIMRNEHTYSTSNSIFKNFPQ